MIFEFLMTPRLLGITRWLMEVAQLQHLHPNHDSLTEGGYLDMPIGIYCLLQCQRHFLLRDTDILSNGSACELVRSPGIS